MKKIIWVGPLIVEPKKLNHFKAISPAANKWQNSFIEALNRNGVFDYSLCYLPEPFFPKGSIFPSYHDSKKNSKSVSYINTPFLRNYSLSLALKNELIKQDYDYIITYNSLNPHVSLGQFAQKKMKKKWINIVADDKYVQGPYLTVFLSYGYYKTADISNKIHIDGGVEQLLDVDEVVKTDKKKIILFSGALNKWTGIEDFAIQFNQCDINDIELHIYGKGNSEIINNAAKKNKNIILNGFVNDKELDFAMRKCDAFINPRPVDIIGGDNSFPSKLLLYLKYGKPIISTKTLGLAPYYDDFLLYYDPFDSDSFIKVIKKFKALEKDELEFLRDKMSVFAVSHSWDNLSKKFINELK